MNTSKKLIIAVSLIPIIIAAIYFKRKTSVVAQANGITESQTPSKKLMDQAKEAKGLEKANLSESEKNNPVCKAALESIETLPLQTLIYDLTNQSLKLTDGCLFTTKNDIPSLEGFPEVCSKLEDNKPSKDCITKLFFYRAIRIHHATFDQPLDSLTTEILITKLIGLLGENAFNSPDGLRLLKEVGAKIFERLPDSESAAKAAAFAYIGDEHLSEQDLKKRDELLDQARNKFPNNWEIYEMDLVRKKSEDEALFKKEVLSFHQSNPNSPIGLYHMGCLQWSDNQADSARTYFKAAVEKAPNDTRFANTLKYAMTTKPPEKICNVMINFDPEKF